MDSMSRIMDKIDDQAKIARLIRLKLWAHCPHCHAEQPQMVLLKNKLYVTPTLRVKVFVCQNPECGRTIHWGMREE